MSLHQPNPNHRYLKAWFMTWDCRYPRYTLKNWHFEPKNGGLAQMIFLFNWVIFRWTSRSLLLIGRNPANQLRLVVYPIIYKVLAPSHGDRQISAISRGPGVYLWSAETAELTLRLLFFQTLHLAGSRQVFHIPRGEKIITGGCKTCL